MTTAWRRHLTTLDLPRDEVHLWLVPLAASCEEMATLVASLSPDEVARADRFRFAHHRERFVVARGALRAILGRYLDVPAERLRFFRGPWGKPALAETAGRSLLHFNLSRSEDLALCAVARDREVGVDLERIRELPELAAIVGRFFAPAEASRLDGLAGQEWRETFFALWTLKEAYAKARGQGLSLRFDHFDVSPALEGRPLYLDDDARVLQRLDVHPGYAAALAVEGALLRLRTRPLEPT